MAAGKKDTTGEGSCCSVEGCAKVLCSKATFLLALCCMAVGLGYGAKYLLSNSETKLAATHFDAIADRALALSQTYVSSKKREGETMAAVLGQQNSTAWPLMTLAGFEAISNVMQAKVGSGMGMAVLVEPVQLPAFEEFAYEHFDATWPGQDVCRSPEFGKGVYCEWLDGRTRRTDGNSSWGSSNAVLAPVLQYSSGASPLLMYDMHCLELRGGAMIDNVMECSRAREVAADDRSCTQLSFAADVVTLGKESPAVIIMEPV